MYHHQGYLFCSVFLRAKAATAFSAY